MFGHPCLMCRALHASIASEMKLSRNNAVVFFVLPFAAVMSTGCAGKKKIAHARPASIGATETGIASWYGVPYHGRRAANGDVYDMEGFTAAYRTLPFYCWVRGWNLSIPKTVD